MPNLTSRYMGIEVKNPLVVGACSLTAQMDSIRRLEDAGAGALVIKSLFEEQILAERYKLEEDLAMYDDWNAEMTDIFPDIKHAGPEEHLMWVRKAKEAVEIPVVGSLNALNRETWVEWARKLEQTGVDALELNFFSIPIDPSRSSAAIEREQIEAVKEVASKVKIPVSVKLSPFYTSPLEVVMALESAGVQGFVLFNRLFHPNFDIETEECTFPFNLSNSSDHRLALRFVGLLAGTVEASLCASNGIHTGADAIAMILAGADVFQVVSTIYLNSLDVVGTILRDIEDWMTKKGYASLDQFRGKLSAAKNRDQNTYRRAQYVRMLLRSDDYIKRPKLI